MIKTKKVGISMPVANEAATIREFLNGLLAELAKLDYTFTVYVIMDSFSRDQTFDLVKEMAEKDQRITLLFYGESTGVVSCYLKGFKLALEDDCDFIVEMDSGGSHPPEKIREILSSLDNEGYDAVFMSRFIQGGGIRNFPLYRRFISRGGTILANWWLGTRYHDSTSGFEAFRQPVLKSLNLDSFISVGGIYQTEMKYYCHCLGIRIRELPFVYLGNTTGFKAKWVWISLKTLFLMKFNRKNVLRQLVSTEY
jgi:dolichol-phosphate mannosyltransferase